MDNGIESIARNYLSDTTHTTQDGWPYVGDPLPSLSEILRRANQKGPRVYSHEEIRKAATAVHNPSDAPWQRKAREIMTDAEKEMAEANRKCGAGHLAEVVEEMAFVRHLESEEGITRISLEDAMKKVGCRKPLSESYMFESTMSSYGYTNMTSRTTRDGKFHLRGIYALKVPLPTSVALRLEEIRKMGFFDAFCVGGPAEAFNPIEKMIDPVLLAVRGDSYFWIANW